MIKNIIHNQKLHLLALVFLCYLSIPIMFAKATALHWLLSGIWLFLTLCVGFTVTVHRLLAHRAFKPPKWFYYFGSFISNLGVYGPPIAAVAMHREHHRFSDTEKDIHNVPAKYDNLIIRLFFRMFLERSIDLMYAKDLLRDKFQVFLLNHYFKINAAYATILGLIDPMLIISMYLFPGAIAYTLTGLGTIITHYNIGYRNHDTKDKSNNHWFLTWFAFGEGLHNNHHAHPSRARFQEKWYEIDIGYYVIKLLDKDAK